MYVSIAKNLKQGLEIGQLLEHYYRLWLIFLTKCWIDSPVVDSYFKPFDTWLKDIWFGIRQTLSKVIGSLTDPLDDE